MTSWAALCRDDAEAWRPALLPRYRSTGQVRLKTVLFITVANARLASMLLNSEQAPVRLPIEPIRGCRPSVSFPLNLDVRYTVGGRRPPVDTGSGRTIDMSSSSLNFVADKPLSIGQKLDVSMDWPALLDGVTGLQLIVWGWVVRTSGTITALRIERYEFRTRRAGLKTLPS